jgi:hypothetical protein
MSGNNVVFYTVMKVKGRHYLYKGIYVDGKKKLIYVGPCDTIEELVRGSNGGALDVMGKNLKKIRKRSNRARRLAWLGRRPDAAEVLGSNPSGPTMP